MAIPTSHDPDSMVKVIDNNYTISRVGGNPGDQIALSNVIHTDNVYNALLNACQTMENRLAESLATYQAHPDVQANLQQLQYDLQQWNIALTTMTNIQKNLADALKSVAGNFR